MKILLLVGGILCYNDFGKMKWFLSILLLFVLFLVIKPISGVFRAFPWPFIAVWLIIPAVITAFRYGVCGSRKFRQRTVNRLNQSVFAITIALSILFFANFYYIRDSIGQRYIKGYESSYYAEHDQFGRSWIASEADTFYWKDRIFLWIFELIYLAICIILPILTFKMGGYIQDHANWIEEKK